MYIIDRFEGEWVVVEHNRKTFNLPKELFPPEAAEGDVIWVEVKIDVKATSELKSSVKGFLKNLFKD